MIGGAVGATAHHRAVLAFLIHVGFLELGNLQVGRRSESQGCKAVPERSPVGLKRLEIVLEVLAHEKLARFILVGIRDGHGAVDRAVHGERFA